MSFKKTLLGGSLILLITINLFNLLNLLFNLSMARLLSLADYASLTVLISFTIIFSIFAESIQTILSKYSTNENSKGRLKNIIKKSFKEAFKFSFGLFILYLILSIPLARILEIDYIFLAISGLMIFVVFFTPITRGVMQGKKMFASLGMNMALDALIKLVLAIFLVIIGIGLYGALTGIIVGALIALLFSFFSLRKIISSEEKPSITPDIKKYSSPVFIVMFSIIVFLAIDVILAKIFFEPDVAGAYAISSTLAKIIFIGTQPIGRAMFPFSTESSKNKNESQKIFKHSFILVSILSVMALVTFYFIPEFVIWVYAGRVIPLSSSLLIYLGIAMALLSFTNLTLLYGLSIGKTKNLKIIILFVIFQIVLLTIFNDNLIEFSLALITASATFLWGSFLLLNR